MQALWSRTGLSTRCACRACDQVLSAGRRATTKASRRKATFAEAFTALYSSFLATAAVVEAVRKEDRKAKVDAELEQVRNELSELRAKRALRELQLGINEDRLRSDQILDSDLTDLQNRALWEQWRRIIDSDNFLADAWQADGVGNVTLALNRNHVKPFGGTRLEQTTILRSECTRIMQYIQVEELDEKIEPHKYREQVHFESAVSQMRAYIRGMLTMATKLCHDRHKPRTNSKQWVPKKAFVRHAGGTIGDQQRHGPSESRWLPTKGGEAHSALEQAWKAFDGPVPEYWYENHPLQRAITIRLNNEIRELFRDTQLPWDELLGRISLSILRSPCLPDVHTHNLLMAGFTRRRFHVLSSKTYELFFSDSNKFRSTPASLAMSVTTPAMFWDIAGFKRAAGAIIGRDPMIGAKLTRKPLEEVLDNGATLAWATDSARRGIAGRWINAYAPMDLAVREALISSLLHLRQHLDAANFFLACLQTGASLASSLVFDLFNAIAKTPDARSAVRLIRGLSVRANKFGEMLRALPEEIRGCVCRRLDYLLHIVNLRWLDVDLVDEIITDLGMHRRHLENLINILEEQGFTNEGMNMSRWTFDFFDQGSRAVASSKPRALSRTLTLEDTAAELPTTNDIAHWAPDLDSKQVAKQFQAQIRAAVRAEVARQIEEQPQGGPELQVHARLHGDLQEHDAEEAIPAPASEGSSKTTLEGDAFSEGIEESIEETVKAEVRRQVEERLRAAKQCQNSSHNKSETTSRPLNEAATEAEDKWIAKFEFRRAVQAGTG